MRAWTAELWYRGPDRLDVAPGAAGPIASVLAPRADETVGAYEARLRGLTPRSRVVPALLAKDEVTLCCHGHDQAFSYRTTLGRALARLGVETPGERPRVVLDHVLCALRFCGARVDTGGSFCLAHWRMLPLSLQRPLSVLYREGQRYDGLCSPAWMHAMADAVRVLRDATDPPDPPLGWEGAGTTDGEPRLSPGSTFRVTYYAKRLSWDDRDPKRTFER